MIDEVRKANLIMKVSKNNRCLTKAVWLKPTLVFFTFLLSSCASTQAVNEGVLIILLDQNTASSKSEYFLSAKDLDVDNGLPSNLRPFALTSEGVKHWWGTTDSYTKMTKAIDKRLEGERDQKQKALLTLVNTSLDKIDSLINSMNYQPVELIDALGDFCTALNQSFALRTDAFATVEAIMFDSEIRWFGRYIYNRIHTIDGIKVAACSEA